MATLKILLVLFLVGVFVAPAEAQAPNNFVFKTRAEAEVALRSGQFYVPHYYSGYKELTEGERLLTLPSAQTGEMLTYVGWRWVAQPKGAEFVVGPNGQQRRWDCGNPTRGFVLESSAPATGAATQDILRGPVGPAGPQGPPGPPGRDGLSGYVFPHATPVIKKSTNWWKRGAIGAIVATLVGGGIYLLRHHNQKGGPVVTTSPSGPVVTTLPQGP